MSLLLHWGKKRVETKLGWVAQFCPICRDIRACRLLRVGLALAFSEVPLGKGELVGLLAVCSECGLRSWVSEDEHASYDRKLDRGMDFLIERTSPSLRQDFAERLALEAEIKRGRTPAGPVRHELLLEPFTAISPMVEEWFHGPARVDVQSLLACGGTMALTLGTFIYTAQRIRGPAQDRALIGVGTLLLLGIAYSLLQLHLVPFRRVTRQALPMIARAVRPLGPSRLELENCLQECRDLNLRVGKLIKIEPLWTKVQLHESRGRPTLERAGVT